MLMKMATILVLIRHNGTLSFLVEWTLLILLSHHFLTRAWDSIAVFKNYYLHNASSLAVKIRPFLPQFFTPVMPCQWQSLNNTVSSPLERLWHLIAQRTLVNDRYAVDSEQCYNSVLLSRELKWNYSVMV